MSTVLRPRYAWIDGAFREGMEIELGGGEIAAVRPTEAGPTDARTAVLPGFVNAHSHAFQRGLRGRGETFTNPADDFWSWREAMYGLVDTLTPESAHCLSLRAFREMRAAGITTVGEFHYIHHSGAGQDFALDEAVLAAAADAGIRIVMLHALYLSGGFDRPLAGAQRRFDGGDLDAWWKAVDRAERACRTPLQSMGVVIHSLRAVPIDLAAEVRREAARRGLVVHLHLEEQPAEIDACRSAHGCTPMRLVLDRLEPGPDMTAVHCTHTDPTEMAAYTATGAHVCLCPLTEANLGDGIADVVGMRDRGGSICLGTDSNARICMLEEMRLCEYGQRLRDRRRGACVDATGGIGTPLLDMATCGGAASLGVSAGRIEAGCAADVVIVDLDHPMLEGVSPADLPAALVTGCDARVIQASLVGGQA
ncbi:MAG: formimidoylglutamate deiminase [Phycisphaerales bacterium]|jgi:formimidoylglutamate deiminase|nr:formimidoylglutamate deiminase [Phycisphaerales bacterium]